MADDLPSPRVGEIPPALSPLDALAMQGRLLARRFQQEDRAGRRISRLAPLTIQNEFGNRPGYFASLPNSTASSVNDDVAPCSPVSSPREQKLQDRHNTVHPQLQSDALPFHLALSRRTNLTPVHEVDAVPSPSPGYFDLPRAHSPEPVEPRIGFQEASPTTPHLSHSAATRPLQSRPKRPSIDSLSPRPSGQVRLLPPKSPSSFKSRSKSPSIRSVPNDSSDELDDSSLGESYDSLVQKQLSPSSSISRSHSPFSPATAPSIPRSPSMSSDVSAGGSQLPRPSFNFSRPLSANKPGHEMRPSMDDSSRTPSRQQSDESAVMRPSYDSARPPRSVDLPTTPYAGDLLHTPVSMTSEDLRHSSDSQRAPIVSYTYSRFNLPRGRTLDRRSVCAEDFLNSQIHWDRAPHGPPMSHARPPSPPSPPRSLDPPHKEAENALPSRRTSSEQVGRPSVTSSNDTIRARPRGSAEATAQDHCDQGIVLHEAGEFLKSTYHLRLAARAGLPEAMFWYGLACRHGWGMRENKAEGMQWLRRAVDSGQLEIADDEDQTRQGKPTDQAKRSQHRARYAVAIYELGKCYMNGWGHAADKSLALRCYEIAGNWGDADALAEAGYCYAEGVGCKKDLKRAAKLYRAAEAKGISMVGNSWYVPRCATESYELTQQQDLQR